MIKCVKLFLIGPEQLRMNQTEATCSAVAFPQVENNTSSVKHPKHIRKEEPQA